MLVKPWIFGPAFTGSCAGHAFSLPSPYHYAGAVKFNDKGAGTIKPGWPAG